MDADELCLETAWGVIIAKGWVASPQLLFALKDYVRELELEQVERDEWKQPEGS